MADDDDESETKKFKLIIWVGLIFFGSMIISCQELKYTMWGKTTDADVHVMEQVTVKSRRGLTEERMRITFTYDDDGSNVKVIDSFPIGYDLSNIQPQGKMPIQYLSGDKYSARFPGTGNYVGVFVFFGCIAVAVLYFIKCCYDAKRPM